MVFSSFTAMWCNSAALIHDQSMTNNNPLGCTCAGTTIYTRLRRWATFIHTKAAQTRQKYDGVVDNAFHAHAHNIWKNVVWHSQVHKKFMGDVSSATSCNDPKNRVRLVMWRVSQSERQTRGTLEISSTIVFVKYHISWSKGRITAARSWCKIRKNVTCTRCSKTQMVRPSILTIHIKSILSAPYNWWYNFYIYQIPFPD